MLREYKNICGKVRSIKFSIKLKQFHQSIESACNDFRNKNDRSAWFKLKKLSHPMCSNSISSSVLKDKQEYVKILNKIHEWAIKNEMTFGINKFATLVVKPINFVKPINYEDPSFFIGSNKLPKTENYTCLGIPFDESLSLKPIQSKLNSNLNVKLNLNF